MQKSNTEPFDESLAGFARRHNLSLTTVYKELNSGRLLGKKVGRRTIITPKNDAAWEDNLPDYPAAT